MVDIGESKREGVTLESRKLWRKLSLKTRAGDGKMARPVRIEYEGAVYHVTARGNERSKIFFSGKDYAKFKKYLGEAKEKYGFLLNAYVLMTNHYHLIVETPEKNLSRIMHYLNGSYTTYTNIKRKRSGHLFQGRYKTIVVDKEYYLLELSRYLHRPYLIRNSSPISSFKGCLLSSLDCAIQGKPWLVPPPVRKTDNLLQRFLSLRQTFRPTKRVYGRHEILIRTRFSLLLALY